MELKLSKEVSDHLLRLNNLADELKFPDLCLCGGVVRDIFFNIDEAKDIDLTVNDGFKSNMLGLIYASKYNLDVKYKYNKNMRILIDSNSLDFSTGNISKFLVNSNYSKIKLETLSRDFTINSLLLNYKNEKVIDITGNGIQDCLDKKVRTILEPHITFNDDPKRFIRAIYYASKYNLEIDSRIYDWAIKNQNLTFSMIEENRAFATNSIATSLAFDEEKTIEFLIETKTIKHIPLVGRFKNILIKRKLLDFYLNEQDQVNEVIDPIGGFDGSQYPKYFAENGPSSVPITFGDSSTYDDNNRSHGLENRQLPYLT